MAIGLLTKKPPARSSERQQLAEAIDGLRAARERRATLAAAVSQAEAAVLAANRAVGAAQDAVEDATEAATRHLVAVAAGTAGEAPRTIRQARNALQDAEDERDTARAAREELKRQETAATTTDISDIRLRQAVEAVLRAEWDDRSSRGELVGEAGAVTRLPLMDVLPGSERHRAIDAAKFQAMVDALSVDADTPLPG